MQMNDGIHLKDNLYAIIIGVTEYDNHKTSNILGAVNDARSLYYFLVYEWGVEPTHIICFPENIEHLEKNKGRVLYKDVKNAIDTMCSSLTEENHLLFFFSGHGLLGEGKGKSYLSFTDSIMDEHGKVGSVLSLHYLNNAMLRCRAKVKVRFFDCCNSGESFGSLEDYLRPQKFSEDQLPEEAAVLPYDRDKKRNPLALSEDFYQKLMMNQKGWITFCACNINEESESGIYGGETEQRGLFSYYLLKCLQDMARQEAPCYIEDLKVCLYRALLDDYENKPLIYKPILGYEWRTPQHMQYQCSISGNLRIN